LVTVDIKLAGAQVFGATEWSEKSDVDSSAMLQEEARPPRVFSFRVL